MNVGVAARSLKSVKTRQARVWLGALGVALALFSGCTSSSEESPSGGETADAAPYLPVDAAPDAGVDAASDVGAEASVEAAAADAADGSPPPLRRLLFIGNSYTAVNGLPDVVEKLSQAPTSPVRFQVAAHTPGGATWEDHDQNTAAAALIAQGWDFVVFQDQSQQPWVNGSVKSALASLDGKAKAAGAKTVLYMTWARSAAVADPLQIDTMNQAVSDYYERNAAAVGAAVAPVGRAWERAVRDPSVVLHAADGSHPNLRGTYLAACVLYATLTQSSPLGLDSGGLSLTASEVSALQQVAEDTIAARQLPAPPLLGIWPLSKGSLGSDIIPSSGLALGAAVGPGGAPGGATLFHDEKLAIAPDYSGISPAALTVVLHAHRQDWSVATMDTEPLVTQPTRFAIWLLNTSISSLIDVPEASPTVVSYDAEQLTAGWHSIALTYDGAAQTLWVDASPVASGTATGNFAGSSQPLGIGAYPAAFGNAFATTHFNGRLADVRLYSKALSAAELSAL